LPEHVHVLAEAAEKVMLPARGVRIVVERAL
jgi:hypothetical protein